jgi:hypothetical protein
LAIVVISWRASHAAPIDFTTLLSKYEQQSGAALNPCTGPTFSLWVPARGTNESALKVLFQLLSSGRIDGGGSRNARYILDLLKLNKKESEILSGEMQRYQVLVQEECQWMTQSQMEWLRAETPQQREALAGTFNQQMKEIHAKVKLLE